MTSHEPGRTESDKGDGNPPIPFAPSYMADDEVSLVDVAITLWRRKWLVLIVIVATLAVGLAFSIHRPIRYRYSTTIEIGTTTITTRGGIVMRPFETPATVRTKLRDSIIPTVLHEYAEQHPRAGGAIRLKVDASQRSQVIVISGTGTANQGGAFDRILRKVTEALVADAQREMQAIRARYEARLAQAKFALDRLKGPNALELKKLALAQRIKTEQGDIADFTARIAFLKMKSKHLGDSAKIIRKEIEDIQRTLETSTSVYGKAMAMRHGDLPTLTMSILSNEIVQNQRLLAELQRELKISQPEERQKFQVEIRGLSNKRDALKGTIILLQKRLGQAVFTNARGITMQQQRIGALQATLDGLPQSRVVSKPTRSNRSVGLGRLELLLVFAFLGVMLALFAVFVAEFVSKLRERMHAEIRRGETNRKVG